MKNVIILVLLVALFGLTNPTRTEIQTGQVQPFVLNAIPQDFWTSLALSGVGTLIEMLSGRGAAALGNRLSFTNFYLFSLGQVDAGRAGSIRCLFALRSGACMHFTAG
jgi:hypothetical protein